VDTVSAPRTAAQTNLTVTAGRATSTEIGSPERAVTVVHAALSIGSGTFACPARSLSRRQMTNSELIARLMEFPGAQDVCISYRAEGDAMEIERVYEVDDFICLEG
jgi:hypothetical protein